MTNPQGVPMATATIEILTPENEKWDDSMIHNAIRAAFNSLYGNKIRVRVLAIRLTDKPRQVKEQAA